MYWNKLFQQYALLDIYFPVTMNYKVLTAPEFVTPPNFTRKFALDNSHLLAKKIYKINDYEKFLDLYKNSDTHYADYLHSIGLILPIDIDKLNDEVALSLVAINLKYMMLPISQEKPEYTGDWQTDIPKYAHLPKNFPLAEKYRILNEFDFEGTSPTTRNEMLEAADKIVQGIITRNSPRKYVTPIKSEPDNKIFEYLLNNPATHFKDYLDSVDIQFPSHPSKYSPWIENLSAVKALNLVAILLKYTSSKADENRRRLGIM